MGGGGNRKGGGEMGRVRVKKKGEEEGGGRVLKGIIILLSIVLDVFLRAYSSAQVFISYVRMTLLCFSTVGNIQPERFGDSHKF